MPSLLNASCDTVDANAPDAMRSAESLAGRRIAAMRALDLELR